MALSLEEAFEQEPPQQQQPQHHERRTQKPRTPESTIKLCPADRFNALDTLRKLWHDLPDPLVDPESWNERDAVEFSQQHSWGIFCGKQLGIEVEQSLLGRSICLRLVGRGGGYPNKKQVKRILAL